MPGGTEQWRNFRLAYLVLGVLLLCTVVAIIIFLCLVTNRIAVRRSQDGDIQISQEEFGTTDVGEKVLKFTLSNSNGMSVEVINFGATLTSIRVPDRSGDISDVILGFDNIAGFQSDLNPYFGATVGRYANRIARGRFTLDDTEYTLTLNTYGDPPVNHLHGGTKGWDKYVWAAEVLDGSLVMTLISPDGDQGYPGRVTCNVTFTLTAENELHLKFVAMVTKKATPINLTSHPYFNLACHNCGTVYDHEILVNADKYTPVGDGLIPTGEIASVAGTPYDIRQWTNLGSRINNSSSGVTGYDNNFCVSGTTGKSLVASLYHPPSGRLMRVYSDQPGIQLYTGDFLEVPVGQGKGGSSYSKHAALCLESQNYPDAPNHDNFPDCILRPGNTYIHNVWYQFSTRS